MNTGLPVQDASFFRQEIERDELALTQAITDHERTQLINRICAAKQYLAELETTKGRV